MRSSLLAAGLACACTALAAPSTAPPNTLCFIRGRSSLPPSLIETLHSVSDRITCSSTRVTLDSVPDVTISTLSSTTTTSSPTTKSSTVPHRGSVSFSSINYAESDQTPLSFALSQFAAHDPLSQTNLPRLENFLHLYLATEAGVLSQGRSMSSISPRLFLEFQVARVKREQGGLATDDEVDRLLKRLVTEAKHEGEDQELIDELRNMAIRPTRLELRTWGGHYDRGYY